MSQRTVPGLAQNLDFRGFTDMEQWIAREFSHIFRINYARVQEFKRKTYAFLIVRPTQEYLQGYILENTELLILFSREAEFDGRIFDFVDVLNSEYKNRIDKLCLILVADNNNLSERIEGFNRSHSEARLAIPVSYTDAATNLEQSLRERLNQFSFGRDLFAFSSPLKSESFFYGRTGILNFIYEKYRNGENAGLFGLRKVGKTSVLHAVQRFLDARGEPSVLIDCQNPSVQLRSWNELLYLVVERLIEDAGVPFLKSLLKESRYQPKTASQSFESDLKQISQYLEGKRVLLMFDEIESITFELSRQPQWREGGDFLLFWQALRAIYQSNDELFSFVLTGVNPKAIETSRVDGADNPIFRIVSPLYLEFFKHDEVSKLVAETSRYMGLSFNPEVISSLTTDFGGHPFLVRQACSGIHRRSPTQRPFVVDRYFYEDCKAEIERELGDYVEQIVSVLKEHYGVEYELLELLAQGKTRDFSDYTTESPGIIEHLKGYGLVAKTFREYHITINCVKQYLGRSDSAQGGTPSKEAKQAEVSDLRNKLETQLRGVVRLVLLTTLGEIAGKQELLNVMHKNSQKNKMMNLTFDELFFSNDRELYFMDLQRIIQKRWSDFGRLFSNDKRRLDSSFETINRYRIDAHDKDISDEELVVFRIAVDWLIGRCTSYLGAP